MDTTHDDVACKTLAEVLTDRRPLALACTQCGQVYNVDVLSLLIDHGPSCLVQDIAATSCSRCSCRPIAKDRAAPA